MSPTWPTVPVSATSLPSRNTGVTTAMSNRWPAQSQGSLVISTSPGTKVAAGNFCSSAFTARGNVRLNTGMARGECARLSPLGVEQVARRNPALRKRSGRRRCGQIVCHISSTTVTRRLHMISSDTGSASISARGLVHAASSAVMRAAAGGETARSMRSVPVASTVNGVAGGE